MKTTAGVGLGALCAFAAASLVACGGGGGGGAGETQTEESAGTSAEGAYGGTITGGSNSAFQLLVLESGEFWSMYGVQSSSSFFVSGFVQGIGVSNNGAFTSTNAKDFGFSPALAGSVNATYNASAHTIAGTVAAPGGTASFSGGAIAGSLYNYDTPASLAAIAGAWSLTGLDGSSVALDIGSNGSFLASSDGCSFTGTVTPRASAKNVFNVALTFGGAPCELPGQAASGIAVAYPLSNGSTQLVVAAVDGTRSAGAAAFGTR